MSVNIYVMSLKRFKSGDYESPLQQVFGAENVTRVTPDGIDDRTSDPPGTIAAAFMDCVRDDEISLLKTFIERQSKTSMDLSDIPWHDEDEVCFAEQATNLEAASTYAHWLGHQDSNPIFEVSDPDDFGAHPVWDLDDDATEYPQLVFHDMYNGYYLPVDFPNVFDAPTRVECVKRTIGSSVRLRKELRSVGKTLGLSWKNEVGLVDESQLSHGEAHSIVVEALMQLSRAAEVSCTRQLPIIFEG